MDQLTVLVVNAGSGSLKPRVLDHEYAVVAAAREDVQIAGEVRSVLR